MMKVVGEILCIPASSAECERMFSIARILLENRTELNLETLDNNLFVKRNDVTL